MYNKRTQKVMKSFNVVVGDVRIHEIKNDDKDGKIFDDVLEVVFSPFGIAKVKSKESRSSSC